MNRKEKIATLRKCLALSKSANEHEAAAALAAAAKLMAELGIGDDEARLIDIEEEPARASRTIRPPKWESLLAQTVGRAMRCAQFIDDRGDRRFAGRVPAPEVAAYAFTVLFRKLKAARTIYVRTKLRRCSPSRKRARADAYSEGWALAVFAKVVEVAPPFADDLVSRYLVEQHPGLSTVASRSAKLQRASGDYWVGFDAGHEIDLHRGMGADAPRRIAHG